MSSKESIAPSVECECLTIKNATSGLKNKAPNSTLKVGTVHALAACGLTVIENRKKINARKTQNNTGPSLVSGAKVVAARLVAWPVEHSTAAETSVAIGFESACGARCA